MNSKIVLSMRPSSGCVGPKDCDGLDILIIKEDHSFKKDQIIMPQWNRLRCRPKNKRIDYVEEDWIRMGRPRTRDRSIGEYL